MTSESAKFALAEERRTVLGNGLSAFAPSNNSNTTENEQFEAKFWGAAKAEPGFFRVLSVDGQGLPNDVDLTESGALKNERITAVAGGSFALSAENVDSGKKRKSKSAVAVTAQESEPVFALGTSSGRITIYSPASATISATIPPFSTSATSILALAIASNTLYAIDESGSVASFSLPFLLSASRLGAAKKTVRQDAMDVDDAEFAPERVWKIGTTEGTGRAASIVPLRIENDVKLLVSFNAQLGLFSAEGEQLKKFKGGHAEPIRSVAVGLIKDKIVAATIAQDELGVNLWNVENGESLASEFLSPSRVIVCEILTFFVR